MEPILEIVKIGDDVLKAKCSPVKEIDSSLKMLTEAMFDELLEADGIGLAAPQIGIPQRFFVVDIRDGKRLWRQALKRALMKRDAYPFLEFIMMSSGH